MAASLSHSPYAMLMTCAPNQDNSSPGHQGIPPRSLNGGLYTGESFKPNAPWGNVPVIPDASYMIHHNLRSANPPPEALFHYPGTVRPGNNEPVYNGIKRLGMVNQNCASSEDVFVPKRCSCHKCTFNKFSYL